MTKDELVALAVKYGWEKLSGFGSGGPMVVLRKGKHELMLDGKDGNICNVLEQDGPLMTGMGMVELSKVEPKSKPWIIGPFGQSDWFSLKANRFVRQPCSAAGRREDEL